MVWSLGALGVTPALGSGMAPELISEYLTLETFRSADNLFLIFPCHHNEDKRNKKQC